MPGFTFDSPFRIVPGQDSQQLANRKAVKNKLPSSNKTTSSSFMSKAKRLSLSLKQKTPSASSQTHAQAPFPFLSLPLRVRQQVYGYVIGGSEKLHILRKYRPSKLPPAIGYRRCRAGISGKSCAGGKCKEMSILDGVYCGWFDKGLSLLLTSKQIYEEASSILYEQNTFDFDDPLALIMFARQISPASLNSIQRIVPAQWEQTWGIVSGRQGPQDVRVKFLDPVQAKREEREVELSSPLYEVKRELRVFEITVPGVAGAARSDAAERAPSSTVGTCRPSK